MKQATGSLAFLVIGLMLIITGFSGRFGVLLAALFAPGEIQKAIPIPPDVTSNPKPGAPK